MRDLIKRQDGKFEFHFAGWVHVLEQKEVNELAEMFSKNASNSVALLTELRTLAKTWHDANGIAGFDGNYFATHLENILDRTAPPPSGAARKKATK